MESEDRSVQSAIESLSWQWMYKSHYQRTMAANPNRLHFAAHSHHPWPDCTRQAVLACWDDASRLLDQKWERIFGVVLPAAQQHVANILKTAQPEQVVFAPNTHEFILRLLSCFPPAEPVRILTSDGEFHSFSRQIGWLEEHGLVNVTRLSSLPASDFVARATAAVRAESYDLVFFSHVFFDSGLCVGDVTPLLRHVAEDTIVVVDAYHSFAAVPTDIGDICDRVFWMGGGYKYAQSGEGVCWLHVPTNHQTKPLNTGWYAEFGHLAEKTSTTPFAADGRLFAGATFDPTGIYRFNAVMEWMTSVGLTVAKAHEYVVRLQQMFLQRMEDVETVVQRDRLLLESLDRHGHFLTYQMGSEAVAAHVQAELVKRNVVTDCRGDRLRFGFGIYQEEADVEDLVRRLATVS